MAERRSGEELFAHMAGLSIDRRTMLQGAAVLSAAMATPALARAQNSGLSGIRFVITDRRFPESTAFGRQMEHFGAERLEVTGGITQLWQERLVPLWREQAGIVAGLTTRAVWDGLSQQALGQFRKPRLLGDHRIGNVGSAAQHKLTLPVEMPKSARAALLEAGAWPAAMAMFVRYCSDIRGTGQNICEVGTQEPGHVVQNQLVSWIVK